MSALKFRSDSLVAHVCNFFLANPDEELDRETVAIKWDVAERAVHTKLAQGVQAGVLVRVTNADDELVYRRGPKLEGSAPAAAPPAAALADALRPRPAEDVEPETVAIESGVPLPGKRQKPKVDWGVLLARMTPGQSALLPKSKRSAVGKACKAAKESKSGEFLIKTQPDKQSFRVWRVA